jgi:diadenylate cyclase
MWDTLELTLWNLLHRPGLADIADILVVAAIVYKLLMLTRDTRGSAVLKGLLLLLVLVGVSNLVGLTALSWLLSAVLNNGPIVLVILFQPEIRKALEQIGRGARIEKVRQKETDEEAVHVVDEIVTCLTKLSRRRVGALIVIEQKTGLKDVIENGIRLNSEISAGLLENIFEPNTPLHDGAVVIRGKRIMSAACILTLTEAAGVSHDLGTRHRAALGVSEMTDAVALIVSEETGIISYARGGKLTRHLDVRALRALLEELYIKTKARTPKQLLSWLPQRTGRKEGEA